ncbi:hypothetical protein [Methylocystis sp.]|uniref:hypothetical protein n=1 Tax=Methylocystis sp. TaxID=1911079 RepID=UPI0027353AF0|nr:hypothetical protein [Methylocystis sp.]MDP3553264.1 hypothetical protein [Methylocystis sp.]
MAFVRIIQEDEFQADTFRSGDSWAIIVNIGYDDITDARYSLVVGLSPMGGGPIEFYFQVVEADAETEQEHVYWCGKEVASFISKDDRLVILAALLTATHVLLENARPTRVEMVSYEANPPDKALVKFSLVGKVFEDSGYAVHVADPYHGKRVWWMERTD